jgi:hypothetical protein
MVESQRDSTGRLREQSANINRQSLESMGALVLEPGGATRSYPLESMGTY